MSTTFSICEHSIFHSSVSAGHLLTGLFMHHDVVWCKLFHWTRPFCLKEHFTFAKPGRNRKNHELEQKTAGVRIIRTLARISFFTWRPLDRCACICWLIYFDWSVHECQSDPKRMGLKWFNGCLGKCVCMHTCSVGTCTYIEFLRISRICTLQGKAHGTWNKTPSCVPTRKEIRLLSWHFCIASTGPLCLLRNGATNVLTLQFKGKLLTLSTWSGSMENHLPSLLMGIATNIAPLKP